MQKEKKACDSNLSFRDVSCSNMQQKRGDVMETCIMPSWKLTTLFTRFTPVLHHWSAFIFERNFSFSFSFLPSSLGSTYVCHIKCEDHAGASPYINITSSLQRSFYRCYWWHTERNNELWGASPLQPLCYLNNIYSYIYKNTTMLCPCRIC